MSWGSVLVLVCAGIAMALTEDALTKFVEASNQHKQLNKKNSSINIMWSDIEESMAASGCNISNFSHTVTVLIADGAPLMSTDCLDTHHCNSWSNLTCLPVKQSSARPVCVGLEHGPSQQVSSTSPNIACHISTC